MKIIEKQENGVSIFKLAGRLDSKTSPEFEKKIFDAIEKGYKKMIVDFEDLDYISSAGLSVILKATKDLKRSDGNFILCSMKDYVKQVFEISGFDSFLPIVPSMDEALKKV
ncbi:MAG: STAS domain-containing protein [Deltaproteobacteria bacterium]|nr:STAS domain-containing protein [Deltaproteobacteria bacterium]